MNRRKRREQRPPDRRALRRALRPPEALELRAAPSAMAPWDVSANSIDGDRAYVDASSSGEADGSVAGAGRKSFAAAVPSVVDDASLSTGDPDQGTVIGAHDATRARPDERIQNISKGQRPLRSPPAALSALDSFFADGAGLRGALSGPSPNSTATVAPNARLPLPYAPRGGSGDSSIAHAKGGSEPSGGGFHSLAQNAAEPAPAPAAAASMAPPSTPSTSLTPLPEGDGSDVGMPEIITPMSFVIPPWPADDEATSVPGVALTAPQLLAVASLLSSPEQLAPLQPQNLPPPPADPGQITDTEVTQLLARAAKATAREDAIIAIVDRNGRILGVHVEGGVAIADDPTLVFAIDGAVAKARTAAFFANDVAPLTSRTVRFISQSTITQREVQSNPNSADPLLRGPGFVAPVGVGGHFPPEIMNTPSADLFGIEHTNRDSLAHPGPNRVKEEVTINPDGTFDPAPGSDDIELDMRFGAAFIPNQEIDAPESYGFVSGRYTQAQSRGIATLPGGVPLYKVDPVGTAPRLVGGIGVFFPGANGDATFEQNFVPLVGQPASARTNAPLVLEAEYTAALVAANTTTIGGMPPVPGFTILDGRIDLGGIKLEIIGPHPLTTAQFLATPYPEGALTGGLQQVTTNPGTLAIGGQDVPTGWLVGPTASSLGGLSAAEVQAVIERGVAEANLVRAAIRLPLGSRTRMVLSVTDLDGSVLGLFRMNDATVFSLDVAVAKARNVSYYAAGPVQPEDRVDANDDGAPDLPTGVAFTNRTFRYVAQPFFPEGIDTAPPGDFSTLRVPGVDPRTAENLPGVTPTSAAFDQSVLGFDAFNPGSNFHQAVSPDGLQNGIVFFPGSTPLYRGTTLVGGLGVSGDGVDQDDVVTFVAAGEFLPRQTSPVVRADEVTVQGVRLPYQKFPRNPHG